MDSLFTGDQIIIIIIIIIMRSFNIDGRLIFCLNDLLLINIELAQLI
jgi:hypothetical protein